uniref:Uncharacterized protein n=1 Tax=Rhizophora mucronata TaxID=61149 RepID=A0A2P2QZG0_RHIMU
MPILFALDSTMVLIQNLVH